MKNIYLTTLFLLTILSSGFTQTNVSKIFQLKSGHILYRLDGSRIGIHEIWWDNYGDSFREEKNTTSKTKIYDGEDFNSIHTIEIHNGKYIWLADIIANTGIEIVNHDYRSMVNELENMTKEERQSFSDNVLDLFNGRKVGKGYVVGKRCKIVKVMNTKIWTYNNIPLKFVLKTRNKKEEKIAEIFEPNITIDKSKFQALTDIEYIDASRAKHLNELVFNASDTFDEELEYRNELTRELKDVSYPFNKFKTIMKSYNPKGYILTNLMNLGGGDGYSCLWIKGVNDAISVGVLALSDKEILNMENKASDVKKFSYHGRTCYFKTLKNKKRSNKTETVTLMVLYKKYNVLMILRKMPKSSKSELLNILNHIEL